MTTAILLRCDGEPWFFAGMDGNKVIWSDRCHALRFSGDISQVRNAILDIKSIYGDELSVLVEVDGSNGIDVAGSGQEATVPHDGAVIRSPMENLACIRAHLRPSVADLAAMLGIPRQVLFDWEFRTSVSMDGVFRLAALAGAVDLLVEHGIPASAQLARRSIGPGKTLLDVVREGGDALQAARVLVGILKREAGQRSILTAHLSSRARQNTTGEEFGLPILDENVGEMDDHEWIATVIRTVRLQCEGVSGFLLACSMQEPATDADLLTADIILCGLAVADISQRKVGYSDYRVESGMIVDLIPVLS